jgi:omega-6 fatty acid desaturase (delta-12 desaturase)
MRTGDASRSRPVDAARAWRASLPRKSRRSSDLRGGLIFGFSAALYILLFLAAFLIPNPVLRVLSVITMPVIIGALFVIGHDAGHGSLMATGWLNRLLGRLAMLPAWHPLTSWSQAHNSMHHGWTNFKGREPAFPPFTLEEYRALPLWRRLLERMYRTPPGIGCFYTIDFYFKHLIFPRPEHRSSYRRAFQLDRLLVAAFLVGQFAAGWALAGLTTNRQMPQWATAAYAVTLPWVLWIWYMGFVSFIQHTHPLMAWYDCEDEWSFYHVQLRSTAHVIFPWPVERLLHNIMDHPAHHLDPTIPLYELPRSQKLLEEACPEFAVVIPWTPLEYLRTCSACKLYDFHRHCWTDFNGNPTSPQGLPGLHFAHSKITPPPDRRVG